jgi:hypothetical protein
MGAILLAILVFILLFKNLMDSPLVLGGVTLVVLLALHLSGVFKHLGELTFEAMIVIILTLVFIQISYPLFSPKVDIISSNIIKGYVDDTGGYVFEIYSATVKKPMIMACGSMCGSYCTDISFFNGVWGEVNSPDVNITKVDSKRAICTYGNFDMITRLIKFNAAYSQPIDYENAATNMTSAVDYNISSGRYFYSSEITNNMPFPVSFSQKTITFTIGDRTKIPVQAAGDFQWASFYNTVKSNYQKNGCTSESLTRLISNSFRISDSITEGKSETIRGYSNAVRIDENKRTIEMDMKLSGTLEPESSAPPTCRWACLLRCRFS